MVGFGIYSDQDGGSIADNDFKIFSPVETVNCNKMDKIFLVLGWLSDNLLAWGGWNLTHWGRVTHICVDKLTTIGSDNGLSPERCQAITWTNAGILLIGPLRTNVSESLSGIQTFSFKKMHLKTSSAKWRPFYFGLNVLIRPPKRWWPKPQSHIDVIVLTDELIKEATRQLQQHCRFSKSL